MRFAAFVVALANGACAANCFDSGATEPGILCSVACVRWCAAIYLSREERK